MKSFTRRLSLLVALILLVTVGGVYAAWEYAASDTVSAEVSKAVSLAPVNLSGTIGTYAISSQFTMEIDQSAIGDYTPMLKFNPMTGAGGDLIFTFTPAVIASDEAKENGIETTVTFSSALQYEGTQIFSFPAEITIGTADSAETYKWVASDDGTYFTCTVSNADLGDFIQLNYLEKLDTYAKYLAFQNAIKDGTIVVLLTNGTSAA